MLDTWVENVNYFAAGIFTHIVNSALPAAAAIALTSLLAWRKKWNAASRYYAWALMLALLMVLPFVPGNRHHVLPATKETPVVVARAEPSLVPDVTITPVTAESTDSTPKRPMPSPIAMFLFCWAAAACLQITRVLNGFVRGLQIKKESRRADEDVQSLFESLLVRAGTRRRVEVRSSKDLASPAVIGYFRPQVILPEALFAELDRSELEQVLLHELAHVTRRDDWYIVIQRIIEAIGVFHPLVTYLAHRMNLDREMACDDRVTALCEARGYASCLTRVAEIRHFGTSSPAIAPLLLERKSELVARVENLLDGTRAHMPGASTARVLLVLACAATVGVAAAFTPGLLTPPVAPESTAAIPAAPIPESSAVPSEPPAPAVPPAPPKQVVPPPPSDSVYSITVTSEDGSSSQFGSWSGEEKGEPGTITFSSGGRRYVIRDRATVAKANELLRPMEELGRKQGELGKQQGVLGEKQRLLGEKQAALALAPLDPETMTHLAEQLRELESKVHEIDVEKQLKTAEQAMQRLSDLQERLAEMEARMGSAQGRLGAEQGRLGEEQGKLGQEQGRLGRMQGELGQQQGREAKRAKKQLEDLIRRAQEQGLARPLE